LCTLIEGLFFAFLCLCLCLFLSFSLATKREEERRNRSNLVFEEEVLQEINQKEVVEVVEELSDFERCFVCLFLFNPLGSFQVRLATGIQSESVSFFDYVSCFLS